MILPMRCRSWLLCACRALGFLVRADQPPDEFAATLRLYREEDRPHVSECPLCGEEVMQCDCQWSAQG